MEVDGAARHAVVDLLQPHFAAFVERDLADDRRLRQRAGHVEVRAAGEVGQVVAHGQRARRAEMDAQAHLALPARGDDRRGTLARQYRLQQRGADVDVAEVERAHHVDVAGDDEALYVAADQQREIALRHEVGQHRTGVVDGQ